jgi:hypothetical protein
MKAELIDVSECKKNLDIEIPQEVVDAEISHIAQDFARKARVPGFRPGKAPVGVVKTRYRDEIVSEMMHHLLPKYFGDAVEERKLEIVRAPQFESVDYASGKPLRFKAVFEVYPSLDISNYTDVPVEQVSTAVEESEVEESLKRLQEDMAELAPVIEDRPVHEGDFAEISFTGIVQGDDQPITADNLDKAELCYHGVLNCSAKLFGHAFNMKDRLDPAKPYAILEVGGKPLPPWSGLAVHTVQKPGKAYYAIVATDEKFQPIGRTIYDLATGKELGKLPKADRPSGC